MRYTLLMVSLLVATAYRAGAAGPVTGNLLENAGLEEGAGMPTGWSAFTAWGEGRAAVEEHEVHSGKRAIRLDGTKPVTQTFLRAAEMQVAPGERFYASGWVRTDHLVGEVGAVLMADFLNVDGHSDSTARFAAAPKEAEGKWVRIEGVVTVPPLAKVMRFRVGMWNCRGVAWFDDVELRALTPASCRVDLAAPRLTPAMTMIPVTVINRAREKSAAVVRLRVGETVTAVDVALTGEAAQSVAVPAPATGRGSQALTCTLEQNGKEVASDRREVVVPAAAKLSPPIPTHWAVEDGPAAIEGEVDVAVTPGELADAKLHVELVDRQKHVLAAWDNPGRLKDGLNTFRLNPEPLAVGTYTLTASLRPSPGELRSYPFKVIHRRDAKTTLNMDGYLVHDGRAVFPLGIFNGTGKSAEMAKAGFTIQHAYNACDVIEGQRPDDDAALEFLDRAEAAGLKCLFLIPRGFVFAGDWEAFRRRVRMFKNHPALLAWDEEEGLARGDMDLKGLGEMCRIIREEDPNHPIMIGDARDEITNVVDRATLFPADLMDLGMWWWYPIPPRPGGGSLLNGDDATSAFELSPPAFLTRAATKKPIWVGVQSYKKEQDWGRYPTPAEYRAQAYIAIIHGAKGLMWYGGYVDGGLFAGPAAESGWDALQRLARELHDLSDILMSPALETPKFEPASAPISMSLRRSASRTVLLAANRDRGTREVVIRLPGRDGTARVLSESREVPVVNGELHDHFDGYGVHVYEWTGAVAK